MMLRVNWEIFQVILAPLTEDEDERKDEPRYLQRLVPSSSISLTF